MYIYDIYRIHIYIKLGFLNVEPGVCVCVCIYTYTHTHTHIYIYIYSESRDFNFEPDDVYIYRV